LVEIGLIIAECLGYYELYYSVARWKLRDIEELLPVLQFKFYLGPWDEFTLGLLCCFQLDRFRIRGVVVPAVEADGSDMAKLK
jgi:hypothetical protein